MVGLSGPGGGAPSRSSSPPCSPARWLVGAGDRPGEPGRPPRELRAAGPRRQPAAGRRAPTGRYPAARSSASASATLARMPARSVSRPVQTPFVALLMEVRLALSRVML